MCRAATSTSPGRRCPHADNNPNKYEIRNNNRTYRRALSDRIKADGHDQLATHVLRARISTMPALTAAAGYDTKDIASVPVPGQAGNHRLQEADVKLITAVGKAFGHRRSEINQTLRDTDCIPVPNLSEARRSDKAAADRRHRVQEAKDAVTGGKPANQQHDTSRRNETSTAQKETPKCEYETQRELEAEWEASKYKRSKVRKEIKRITQGRRDAMNERFSQRTYQDSLSQTQMESVRIEFEQRAAAALKNPRELWRVGMFALPELEDVHRLPTTPTVDTEGEEQSESLF